MMVQRTTMAMLREVSCFFTLNMFSQLLGGHVLSDSIVGVDQTPIVVLGILALHGDRVAEHSGFTAKIHSHSGVVKSVSADNHCLYGKDRKRIQAERETACPTVTSMELYVGHPMRDPVESSEKTLPTNICLQMSSHVVTSVH